MLQKTLHRPPAGEQYQHTMMFFALQLLTKIGCHFGNMLLFVINGGFVAHLRNHQFPLFHMIKRRIQRHKAVAGFFF
ncbi:Uncharacterised protein [Salmonella enterica subsp. enterica serovar Bovismorbificans]|uniref:Uncharacterized protein n=1 Tax=Salmonella enterica subsp. enterica serovar Bovismorbificans TaxID=58097 RepID=A0A655BP01_SALET|nr:Uncharacterised protein [Salmonella enterica subsp. enterica serovar Bovismorbificans]